MGEARDVPPGEPGAAAGSDAAEPGETKVVSVARSEAAKKRVIEGFQEKNLRIRALELRLEAAERVIWEARFCARGVGRVTVATKAERRLAEAIMNYDMDKMPPGSYGEQRLKKTQERDKRKWG